MPLRSFIVALPVVSSVVVAAGAPAGTPVVPGVSITAAYDTPALDRWNYPFNPTPGSRASASVFGTAGYTEFEFDDRDALFLIGFNTDADVPAGLPLRAYRVVSATLTTTVATGGAFRYDPTYDSFRTHLRPDDPDFLADGDAGRPVELFGAGFRNGFTSATFLENSPHGPAFGLGARNAFVTDFAGAGDPARDIANNVKDRFEPAPFAIGQTTDAAPGALVPADAVFTFALDVEAPNVRGYLRDGLASGRLRFHVSSLIFPAFIGPPSFVSDRGAPAVDYPVFFTKEDKFAEFFQLAPTLSITVEIVDLLAGDTNADGVVNFLDLNAVLSQFGQSAAPGGLDGDVNADGVVNFLDLNEVLSNFGQSSAG